MVHTTIKVFSSRKNFIPFFSTSNIVVENDVINVLKNHAALSII